MALPMHQGGLSLSKALTKVHAIHLAQFYAKKVTCKVFGGCHGQQEIFA